MSPAEGLFTAQHLAEVRAYHAPLYTWALVDLVASPLLLLGAATLLPGPLHRLSARLGASWRSAPMTRAWGGSSWSTAVLFAVMWFGLFSLLHLPAEVWLGYVREKAWGLSRYSADAWARDALKAQLLFTAAVAALAFGLYGLARRTRHWWWVLGLVASGAMVASTALDPWRGRIYVDQAPLPSGALRSRLESVLAKAGVEFSDILVDQVSDKTVRVQAAFAGTGPTRAILLTDTLLASMTEDEVAAAVAHEAAHVHESRWFGRLLSPLVLLLFLGWIEWLFRRSARHRWLGITERADIRTLPLVVLVFDLSMLAAAPAIAVRSRARELEADRYAVQLTGDAAAFRSMLVTVARVNKTDPVPPRWYVLKGLSHPPLVERLAALPEVGREAPPSPSRPGQGGEGPGLHR